jgi:hypothetical protein
VEKTEKMERERKEEGKVKKKETIEGKGRRKEG